MLAYHKDLLENEAMVSNAKSLYEEKFISKEQFNEITSKLVSLDTNSNLLIRFGFFLLGCFLFSSIIGSVSLLFMPLLSSNYEIMPFFYFGVGIIVLEILVRKNYFKHGLDDAFIVCSQFALYLGVGLSFESSLMVCLTMFIFGAIFCLRYVNALSMFVCCIGLMAFTFLVITEHSVIPKALLPFIAFSIAILLYIIYLKLNSIDDFYFYEFAFQNLKVFSLVLGYFSLNYMVVRELSESLLNVEVLPGKDIPLAFIFYATTFIIPAFYIGYSLFKKDRIILFVGILTFAYSIFTIRYYHQLLPIEVALVIGGIVLFIVAYLSIKRLQFRETGLTFKAYRGSDSSLLKNAQALIISTQVPNAPAPNQSDMPFGGGGFSGGGAGSKF
ncbi:hypothetical protein [Flavobacterium sp.]|jgi:hypothetical protein|uniref:hypothetical protein n=1 Tax=Flavobacterium sp. TaxID=239 RepID=UPI002A7FA065|nr:hypothetical protein [Flavobacterium sp.]